LNPGTARLETSWLERWLFPILMVSIMLVLSIVANVWIVRTWRRGGDIDIG
jgi:hypothetical protein